MSNQIPNSATALWQKFAAGVAEDCFYLRRYARADYAAARSVAPCAFPTEWVYALVVLASRALKLLTCFVCSVAKMSAAVLAECGADLDLFSRRSPLGGNDLYRSTRTKLTGPQ